MRYEEQKKLNLKVHQDDFSMYLQYQFQNDTIKQLDYILQNKLKTLDWLYLAALPKSGSTFIAKKLTSLLAQQGYIHGFPFGYSMDRPQDLDIMYIAMLSQNKFVCQSHTSGSLFNTELMRRYHIKPVILMRDLRDQLLSNHDHFYTRKEGLLSPIGSVQSMKDENWFEKDRLERLRHLIKFILPGIVDWCNKWYENRSRVEHLVIKYEELHTNKITLFERVLDFYGLSVSEEILKENLEKDQEKELQRLNKAIPSRWKTEFPEELLPEFKAVAGKTMERWGYAW